MKQQLPVSLSSKYSWSPLPLYLSGNQLRGRLFRVSVIGNIVLLVRLMTIFLPIKKQSETSQTAAETLALTTDSLALL